MVVNNWKELLCPYEQAVGELIFKFNSIAQEYRKLGMYAPIDSVHGRVKKINSIMEKCNKKNVPLEDMESKIEDIAGIRIICQFVEDIAKVVILIRERSGVDLTIVEEKDYITHLKPSGYRSYHLIIKYPVFTALGRKEVLAEIQIRTLAMNFWATIEHSLKYKYSGNIPSSLQQRLVNCAEAAYKLDTEMSTIRSEITEAQKIYQIKTDLVAEIVENISRLHLSTDFADIETVNRQFFDLYEEDDIEKLYMFNQQLSTIVELYRID